MPTRRRRHRPGRPHVRPGDPLRGLRGRPPRHRRALVRVHARRGRRHAGADADGVHDRHALRAAPRCAEPTRSSSRAGSTPTSPPSAALVRALRAAHARGARIVSLCTGAFVLADAGLLDGRRATTHWLYADRLRRRCPRADRPGRPLRRGRAASSPRPGRRRGSTSASISSRSTTASRSPTAVARRIVMPLYRAGRAGAVRGGCRPSRRPRSRRCSTGRRDRSATGSRRRPRPPRAR